MRLFELNNLQPFNPKFTGMPTWDDMLEKPDYFREEKHVESEVVWMSPTEYIERAEDGFADSDEPHDVRAQRDNERSWEYAELMKKGVIFPMATLDYRWGDFGQEGLHRAVAAEQIGIKKMPVMIARSIPKKNITEGLSPVLYHFTSPTNTLNMLKQNKIKLAAATGTRTERDLQPKDRVYYLSTTRHKMGGYHLSNDSTGVMINFDGVKLGQRYKGKAVDYWGPEWYGADRKGHEEKEAEDRLFSTEPYIPNAKQYILAIHIMYTEKGQKYHKDSGLHIRRLIIAAKSAGIPTYLYDNAKTWMLQNTKKAIDPNSIELISKASGKKSDQGGYYPGRRNDFSGWLELYHINSYDRLTKNSKLEYRYVTDYLNDGISQLKATIHNNKTKPDQGLSSILRIMRKEKLPTVEEFVEFLQKKWQKEYEMRTNAS